MFEDVGVNINKIAIPTGTLNKNDNSQYHLVQIIRNLANTLDGEPEYEDSLYIDGLLESVDRGTFIYPSVVSKIILNNVNVCYNLINVQYFSPIADINGNKIKFNPDAYAYQYWLSYKEKYVNSNLESDRITSEEIFLKDNMDSISFDGTNVVVESDIIMNIAGRSDLPTVVFSYDCEKNDGPKTISQFMELMWQGRPNGDETFRSREIDLYWIPPRNGGNMGDYKVNVPNNFRDNEHNAVINGN